MQLNSVDWQAIAREACSRSFPEFVINAWPVMEPTRALAWGWHMDVICEHLEAVTRGEILRLLINIPPGTMKSSLVSVLWPAWEWANDPTKRYVTASHEQGLAIRDARKMRNIVASEWYQRLWAVELTGDQNEKRYFENKATGFRQACAVASMTGKRGDRVIWDDPHNVEGALSDADRKRDVRIFHETLPTRLNDPDSSAIVIVMQRLHEEDVSGEALSEDFGYEHLCLPMEFEKARACVTSLGPVDRRTEEGELLFPERFPREVVDRDKKIMGAWATAGQLQQRPAPRGGGTFEWEKIAIVSHAPELKEIVRYWDKAGTQGGGAYTAGVLMGLGVDGVYYVLDVVRGQWEAPARERTIKQTAQSDSRAVPIWIEQEPGSGGKESAQATIRNLAGFVIRAERPTGDKALRAEPFSVQVEAGAVKMVAGAWNSEYLHELRNFPVGKYKDQVDASSGAFSKLTQPTAVGVLLPPRLARAH